MSRLFGSPARKFRHVFGLVTKEGNDASISVSCWDSNKIAVNYKYVAIILKNGNFCVFNADFREVNSVPIPKGHKGMILDIDLSPFDLNLCATASEDCKIGLWNIEMDFDENISIYPSIVLEGHKRKVGNVKFHPTAPDILATSSTDLTMKIWDIEKGMPMYSIDNPDIMKPIDWNYDGSLLIYYCRDKTVNIIDPRQGKESALKKDSHGGIKGSRCIWLGESGNFCDVGFSRTAERVVHIIDPRNLSRPLHTQMIDYSAGILMPFYDNDVEILYLAGKGDGNVRYYSLMDQFSYISNYQSCEPCIGMAMKPKIGCNVMNTEITCLIKAVRHRIHPIHFYVPRKNDCFQEDLFMDTPGIFPSSNAQSWMEGNNYPPIKVSLPFSGDSCRAKSARK